MEKDVPKTGQEGSSRSLILSSSASAQPFLNYHSGSQHFGIPEAERMMMTSSSHQKEFLMDMLCYQSLVDKHNATLFLLKEAVKEAEDLRKENFNLENINADLSNRLAVLQKAMSDRAASFGYSAMHMDPKLNVNEVLTGLESLQLMDLGSGVNQGPNLDDVATERGCTSLSPTPISRMDSGQIEGSGEGQEDRVALPKSIGIRSTGYLKMVKPDGRSKGKENKQKVIVQGDEKEEEPLELEVYNQGTSKTELCNKWQETGACSYEEKCHFAHGVEELRPVIRHPRYKTDVCRMVLNGDPCPYGHRCHFRHTLSEKEKLIRSNNLRALKPLNK